MFLWHHAMKYQEKMRRKGTLVPYRLTLPSPREGESDHEQSSYGPRTVNLELGAT